MPRGVWVRIASMRTRLIATAVKICCKWVLWRPSYLARRSPIPRTPCESVPSMPARLAYCLRNSGVCCSCRRGGLAECAACGRRCSTRPVVWERVQSLRTGQPAHTSGAKTTSIRSPARLQRELWCPCGQVARLSWPIELEVCHIKAFACFGLPTVIRQGWTQQSDPILFLTADQQIGIDVARIHDLLFWQQLVLGQVLLNEGRHLYILQRFPP